ncbi:hypothetical protein BD779DRAFT_1476306 [Infundibulicybe gibba]|nr:hypothetical protein BD779DRAFT_1476306 [Infundibulicybe gibba]
MQNAHHAPSSQSTSSSLQAGGTGTPSQAASTISPRATASLTPLRAVSRQPQMSSSRRPKVGDYKDPVPGLILKAIHEYECRIWTRDAFPSNDLVAQWVGEVWECWGRNLKGICINTTDISSAKNREKYDTLMNDAAFHYSDPVERTGFALHPIIKRAIKETWFQRKNSPRIVFTEYFNPITVANLAIIFTTIEFCIQEWSTGTYIQGTLNEDRDKSRYHVFVCRLTEWDSLKPQVTLKIRRKLHDRSRRLTGVRCYIKFIHSSVAKYCH